MIKRKINIILLAIFIFMFIGILLFTLSNNDFEYADNNKQIVDNTLGVNKLKIDRSISNTKYAQIIDKFDIQNEMTFSEIMNSPESSKNYRQIYNSLNNDNKITFLEISNQLIEYQGIWSGDSKFVYGSNENSKTKTSMDEFINQKVQIKGELFNITPLKCILLGKNASDFFNLSTKISDGCSFNDNDYFTPKNKEIKVLLGASYKKLFEIGDEFKMLYIGEEFRVKVIGFIKKDTELPSTGKIIMLNNYIIMPSFDIMEGTKDLTTDSFDLIHYSNKIVGSIPYTSDEEYISIKSEIEEIVKKYNYPYTVINNERN